MNDQKGEIDVNEPADDDEIYAIRDGASEAFDSENFGNESHRAYWDLRLIARIDLEISQRKKIEAKCEKLKALILLTDPIVSGDVVNAVALKQWYEFISCFPDEGG